ncbi:MAG: hypothetical protein Tp125SUR00d2C35697761_21 [Prokaryotic dsDNA virus sp.]|nr:MAG: hypothetical protein Tp125SUR00d2C35697761_21 [Prokaryotic dsDNA virus sp.]|tara:strand:- start:13842 stop:14363 length:522 start_codon:yes stop_codon:yes gene_type:complete
MVATRRSGGGRKPTVHPNPFVIYDEWGDPENILWDTEDVLDIRIEDILVGCVRAFNAGSKRQNYINWYKLLRTYRNVWELSATNIKAYLCCSDSQAHRYMQVIKLANPFIDRYMEGRSGSSVRGYVDLTFGQVRAGYNVLGKPKEGVVETNKTGEESCKVVNKSLQQLLGAAK